MSTLVVVLDADVLVPILSCDLLLSAFDEDLYRPVVTATILHETDAPWFTASPTSTRSPCGVASPKLQPPSHITPTTKATSTPQRLRR